jgi:hypothetical protein
MKNSKNVSHICTTGGLWGICNFCKIPEELLFWLPMSICMPQLPPSLIRPLAAENGVPRCSCIAVLFTDMLENISLHIQNPHHQTILVPDQEKPESQCHLSEAHSWPGALGIWNREVMGEGMRKGRSFYEQPGAKVDRVTSRQRRVSK